MEEGNTARRNSSSGTHDARGIPFVRASLGAGGSVPFSPAHRQAENRQADPFAEPAAQGRPGEDASRQTSYATGRQPLCRYRLLRGRREDAGGGGDPSAGAPDHRQCDPVCHQLRAGSRRACSRHRRKSRRRCGRSVPSPEVRDSSIPVAASVAVRQIPKLDVAGSRAPRGTHTANMSGFVLVLLSFALIGLRNQ